MFSAQTSRLIASHQIPVKQHCPHEGWVEQDPVEIVEVVKECMAEVAEKLREQDIDPSRISAVGVTNQRETTVVWDKNTGKPFYNAIGKFD